MASSPAIYQALLKPNLPLRATSENCAATRTNGSSFVDPGNAFYMLDEIDDVDNENCVPDYLNQDRIEGRIQKHNKLMLKQPEMAGICHTSHGHCNNRQKVLNLKAKCIECNYLKHYILAHRCDAGDAAPGRRHHKAKATTKARGKTRSTPKTVAQIATAIAPAFDSQNKLTEHLDLEFSTITDAINPTVKITEPLARLFQHTSKNSCDYPDIAQIHHVSNAVKDSADAAIGEGATTSSNTTTPLFSQPCADLRMDCEDACSLGCLPDLNWHFLLVIDKGTEYFVSSLAKTRASPVALPKQFGTLTGRKIRYLRIDNAKEFQSDEIKEYLLQTMSCSSWW